MHSWPDSSLSLLNTAFWVITIAGIVFGLIAQVGAYFVRKETGWRQDQKITGLKHTITEVGAKAAQANEKAEAEHLERVKLEASIAPRMLVIKHETTEELKLFAGTKVAIGFEWDDREARGLAEQIAGMAKAAKWDVTFIPAQSRLRDGVEILVKRLNDSFDSLQGRLGDAATILAYQLKDNGIEASCWTRMNPKTRLPFVEMPSDIIIVSVGEKPNPYFQAKSLEKALSPTYSEGYQEAMRDSEEAMKRFASYEAEHRMEIIKKYKRATTENPVR